MYRCPIDTLKTSLMVSIKDCKSHLLCSPFHVL